MFFYRIRPAGDITKTTNHVFYRIRTRWGHHKNDKPCFFAAFASAGDITKTTNHVLLHNLKMRFRENIYTTSIFDSPKYFFT